MTKAALIFGVSGQDGAYLSQLLLQKGYEVHGTTRDKAAPRLANLNRLGIAGQIHTHATSLLDFRELLELLSTVKPDEVYHLAGQSSVGLSFSQPIATYESITVSTQQILEAIRHLKAPTRFYNASSSECFGQVAKGSCSSETSAFAPRSPYAVAKAAAYWATANYREAYNLFCCSGILFNHESPLRPPQFVTQKIVSTAVKIARGEPIKLRLGNIDIYRDWGYAPEYVEAMWMLLQNPTPEDFVIATGRTHRLEDFISGVFSALNLDWREHTEHAAELARPTDVHYSAADPSKARTLLGWEAKTSFEDLTRLLVAAEMELPYMQSK